MSENIIREFPVTIYGNLEKYNNTISKGRCRIFYKYENRNGTYITDEFAEKLIASVPYTPVKGIFEDEVDDYTDHGSTRNEGRIYGIVPENPNFAWEKHLDEDGIEREYACVDVLIYTALYSEASDIIGKSQSMELYPKSIKGNWKIINGKKFYVYEDGCFLGLQVLGDDVEPCFEGASFYSLYKELKNIVVQFEHHNLNLHNGGNTKMLNYKLSDSDKFNALWSLLNVNYCEQNDWIIEYDICEIYDEYAVVKNYVENIFERVYYSKNDETDSLEITARERCYFEDVTESEKNALKVIRELNNNTYEKIDENYSAMLKDNAEKTEEIITLNENLNTLTETYNVDKNNFEMKIEELSNQVSTLTIERDETVSKLEEAGMTMSSLATEIESLRTFKQQTEKNEKQAVLDKYSKVLDKEVINNYSEQIDNYDIKDLEKELAYALVSTNQTVFTSNPAIGLIPKDEPLSGVERILSNYQK